ncbi:restriction endonuclease subunit S [Sphaerisporangium sp. NPDC049003]|uniref:restriction endonuclease subunit S n=1 Tax=Sphaerisporangium sp. NPDC049003 TaxID=3364517 RepID=UPI00370F7876
MHDTPVRWSRKKLLDLVSLPSGQVNPQRSPYSEQPLIAPDHVESGTGNLLKVRTAREQGAVSGKYIIRPGDVVYSKIRPALRKAAMARFDGLCSADMYPLRPSGQIDSRYLLAVLLGEGFSRFAEALSGRSGIPKINREELEEYVFMLPPIAEQRRIVEILDVLDLKFDAQRRLVIKLTLVAQAVLEAELNRLACESEQVIRLGAVAHIGSGVTLGTESGGAIELPYLRVANVQDGFIDTSEMKTVRISRSDLKRYLLQSGDVLLTEGGDLDKLGRGAVWDARIDPCICQNHIFRVRSDRSRILPEYLASYASSSAGKSYFLSIAKQTTNLATINSTQLKAMPIPLVSLERQENHIAVQRVLQERLEIEKTQLNRMGALKQGLMEDLLTGRVRISEGEAVLEGL